MRELDARDPQQDAVQFQSIRPPPKPYGARPQDEQSSPQGQCEEVHESGGLQLLACSEQCRIYAAVRGIRHVARAPGAAPRETTRAGFGCSLPTTKGVAGSVRPPSELLRKYEPCFFEVHVKASSPSPVSRRRVIMVGMPHTTLLILDRHFDDRGCGVSPRLSGSALAGLRLQPYSARRCGNCLRNDANSTPITHRQDCRHALLYARQSAHGTATKSIALSLAPRPQPRAVDCRQP